MLLNFLVQQHNQKPRTVIKELEAGQKLIIGRSPHANIFIDDKNVSREHCQVLLEEDSVLVQDLESRNGSFVNHDRVISKLPLEDGDEIRLAGTTTIRIFFPKDIICGTLKDLNDSTTRLNVYTLTKAREMQIEQAQGKTFLQGKVFNGYRLDERIGAGENSVIYKGVHLSLDKTVAIKTLAQHLVKDPNAIERFLKVAKVSGQLNHPNIVQIYDSNRVDEYGIYYIVMEYVAGEPLSSLIKPNICLPIEKACRIIKDIAHALHHANKKNIIHRDINPSNILVTETGTKLIGLGLSKFIGNPVSNITRPGFSIGKLGYIAPEHLQDQPAVDHRSDIYSLGAVFYRCVCGQTPYNKKNMQQYLDGLCHHIAPYRLNDEIPRALSCIICKALSFDPDTRYQQAGEFAEDIEYFLKAYEVQNIEYEEAVEQMQAMFSEPPRIEALDFKLTYRPLQGIGGDFYSFIELKEDEIGIVIGDITGHGLKAAVVVGMVKSFMESTAKQASRTSEAISKANNEICPRMQTNTFAAISYLIIHHKTLTLHFTRAGHTPLILYNPERSPKISTFEPAGMVVGMFDICRCDELVMSLIPGDCLILFTDGVIEMMNDKQQKFGMKKLCQTICRVGSSDIEKIVNSIESGLDEFVGTEGQQDDVTIMGIKIK